MTTNATRNATRNKASKPTEQQAQAEQQQADPLAALLEQAAAQLVTHLPSAATGTPREAPTIQDAGSPDVIEALRVCVDRYGEPLEPLTCAAGWVHLIGGRRLEAPKPRKRTNAATALAAVAHATASSADGLPVDSLYRLVMVAREAGVAGKLLKPGTGPEAILAIAGQQYNVGYTISGDGIIRTGNHKVGKPGAVKWLKVEQPAQNQEAAN